MKTLHVKYMLDESLVSYPYTKNSTYHPGDSGFDLFVQNDTICAPHKVTTLHHDIACEMVDMVQDSFTRVYHSTYTSYFLVPRSSISKTPLMMANSIGIVDAGYRGEIMGRVYNTSDEDYVVAAGTRLFQIVAPDLSLINVEFVTSLSDTSRGTNGIGSTGV